MDSLAGKVEVRLFGTEAWTTPKLGDCLFGDDRIKTDADSGVALALNDGGQLKLPALSDMSLIGARRKGDDAREVSGAELGAGELWAEVEASQGAFDVTTPTGVVSVRGTEFSTRVDKDKEGNPRVQVFSLKGEVEVADKDRKKKVKLLAGKTAKLLGKELSDAFDFDVGAFKDYLNSWKDLLTPGGIRDFIKAKAFEKLQEMLDGKLNDLKNKLPGGGDLKPKLPGGGKLGF